MYSPAEVAVIETFVIPRYLGHFGKVALEMFLAGDVARVAHLGCRTGYPDRRIVKKVRECSLVGVDASTAAIELARNKAATLRDADMEYRVGEPHATDLPAGNYSHVLTLHPLGQRKERARLFTEMDRLLYSGGQALVALPMRGSFQELNDLLREYALKFDDGELGRATEYAAVARPTMETLSEELEAAGLDDIDVEVVPLHITFEGGRAFTEDPASRLMILPEIESTLGQHDIEKPLAYVRDAIDKYWSESRFRLTLMVGVASARKR